MGVCHYYIPVNGRSKDELYDYLYQTYLLRLEDTEEMTDDEITDAVNSDIIDDIETCLMAIAYQSGSGSGYGGGYGLRTCYRTWDLGTMESGSPIADLRVSVSDFEACVPLSVDVSALSSGGVSAARPLLFTRLSSGEYIPASFIPPLDVSGYEGYGYDGYGYEEEDGTGDDGRAGATPGELDLGYAVYMGSGRVDVGCFLPGDYTVLYGGPLGDINVLLTDALNIGNGGAAYAFPEEDAVTGGPYGKMRLSANTLLQDGMLMGLQLGLRLSNIQMNASLSDGEAAAEVWLPAGTVAKDDLYVSVTEFCGSLESLIDGDFEMLGSIFLNAAPMTVSKGGTCSWALPDVRAAGWTASARICDALGNELPGYTAGTDAWAGLNIVNGNTSLLGLVYIDSEENMTGMTTTVKNKATGQTLGSAVGDEGGSALAPFTLPLETTALTIATEFSLPAYDLAFRFAADTTVNVSAEDFETAKVVISGTYGLAASFDSVSVFNLTRTLPGTVTADGMTVPVPADSLADCYLQFGIGGETIRCDQSIAALGGISGGTITVPAEKMPNAGVLKLNYPPYANGVSATATLTFLDGSGTVLESKTFKKIRNTKELLYAAPAAAVRAELEVGCGSYGITASADRTDWTIVRGGTVTADLSLTADYLDQYEFLRVCGITEKDEQKPITESVPLRLTAPGGETYHALWNSRTSMLDTADIPAGTYTVTEENSLHLVTPVSLTVSGGKGTWSGSVPTLVLAPAATYRISLNLQAGGEAAIPDDLQVWYWPVSGGDWTEMPGTAAVSWRYAGFLGVNEAYGVDYLNGGTITFTSRGMPANEVDVSAGLQIRLGDTVWHAEQQTAFRTGDSVLNTNTIADKTVSQTPNDEDDVLGWAYVYYPKLEWACTLSKALTEMPDCALDVTVALPYVYEPIPVRAVFADRAGGTVHTQTFTLPAGSYLTEPRTFSFPGLPRGTYDLLLLPDTPDGSSRESEFLESPDRFTAAPNMGETRMTVTFTDAAPAAAVDYAPADAFNPWQELRFENSRGKAVAGSEVTQVLRFAVDRDGITGAPYLEIHGGPARNASNQIVGTYALPVCSVAGAVVEEKPGYFLITLPDGSGLLTGTVEFRYQMPGADRLAYGEHSYVYAHGMGDYQCLKTTMASLEASSGLDLSMPAETADGKVSYSGTYSGGKLYVGAAGSGTRTEIALNRFGGFSGELTLPGSVVLGKSAAVAFTKEDGTVLEERTVVYCDTEILPTNIEFTIYDDKNDRTRFSSASSGPDESGNYPGLENASLVVGPETGMQEIVIALTFAPEDSRFVYDPYITVHGFYYDEAYCMYATETAELELGKDAAGAPIIASVPTRYEIALPTTNFKDWSFGYATYSLEPDREPVNYRLTEAMAEAVAEAGVSESAFIEALRSGVTVTGMETARGECSCSESEGLRAGYGGAMDFEYRVTSDVTVKLADRDALIAEFGLDSELGLIYSDDRASLSGSNDFVGEWVYVKDAEHVTEADGSDTFRMTFVTVTVSDADELVAGTEASLQGFGGYNDTSTATGLAIATTETVEYFGYFTDSVSFIGEVDGIAAFRDIGDAVPKTMYLGLGLTAVGAIASLSQEQFPEEWARLKDAEMQLQESRTWALRTCQCPEDAASVAKIEQLYQEGCSAIESLLTGLQVQEHVNTGVGVVMGVLDAFEKTPAAAEGAVLNFGVNIGTKITNGIINSGRWQDVQDLLIKYANGISSQTTNCKPEKCIPRKPVPKPDDSFLRRQKNYRLVDKSMSGPSKIVDPSGTVYEGILSNPLEGVTCTIWYSATNDGPESWEIWNAALYKDQLNPIVTKKDGYYNWDVPEGFWKVQYEKEGYETAWSEVMRVPPDRRNVNQAMIPLNASEFTANASATKTGATLQFTTPVYASELTNAKITLLENGAAKDFALSVTDAESGLARTVSLAFTPDAQKTYVIRVTDVSSYQGVICSFDVPVDMNELAGRCAPVTANIASDTIVSDGTAVFLSTATVDAEIWYTLDGSCPCVASNSARLRYDEEHPPVIQSQTQLIACAVRPDLKMSETTGFTYFTAARTERYVTTAKADSGSVTAVVSTDLSGLGVDDEHPCTIILAFFSGGKLIGSKAFTDITEPAATVCARAEAAIGSSEVLVRAFIADENGMKPLCENESFPVNP